MENITDFKRKLTLKDHGKVLRVGKRHFRRIWMEGGWDFWNHGFVSCAQKNGDFIYKDKKDNWFKEV